MLTVMCCPLLLFNCDCAFCLFVCFKFSSLQNLLFSLFLPLPPFVSIGEEEIVVLFFPTPSSPLFPLFLWLSPHPSRPIWLLLGHICAMAERLHDWLHNISDTPPPSQFEMRDEILRLALFFSPASSASQRVCCLPRMAVYRQHSNRMCGGWPCLQPQRMHL